MLLVWTTIGLLLADGFSRSQGSELVVLPLALAMVVVTGYAIGFSGLPFVGAVVDVAEIPLAATPGALRRRPGAGGGPHLGAGPRHPRPPPEPLSRRPRHHPRAGQEAPAGWSGAARRVVSSARRPARKLAGSTSPSRTCWNTNPGSRPARTGPTCSAGTSAVIRPRAW
jgi:hypothetical protein